MKLLVTGLDSTTVVFLQNKGFKVERESIRDPEELEEWLAGGLYDACVIDMATSKLGIFVARGLRVKKIATPILAVVSLSEVEGATLSDLRAKFLENGGDDLLRGPVNPTELAASLRAIIRRYKGGLLDILEMRKGGAVVKINAAVGSSTVNGQQLQITNTERGILATLATSGGRVISKEQFLLTLYDVGADVPDPKIVDVFICKIRKKMKKIHKDAEGIIQTVWGQGYRLSVDSEPQESPHQKKRIKQLA